MHLPKIVAGVRANEAARVNGLLVFMGVLKVSFSKGEYFQTEYNLITYWNARMLQK